MYKTVRQMLYELKDYKLQVIIDEGRSRKRKEKCKIKKIYNRIFLLELNNEILSFSFNDLICKTITLKKV